MSAKRRSAAAKAAAEHVITFPRSTRIAELAALKELATTALADGTTGTVVCELGQVEAIDAAALQFLVALRIACEQAERPCVLRASSTAVVATAHSCGFSSVLALDTCAAE